MNIITYPEKSTWADLLKRPTLQTESLRETVLEILNRIKFEGDKAVREYEEKFDKVRLDSLQVSEAEIAEAEKKVSIELKAAITLAYKNIHTFHAAQMFQGKRLPPCRASLAGRRRCPLRRWDCTFPAERLLSSRPC